GQCAAYAHASKPPKPGRPGPVGSRHRGWYRAPEARWEFISAGQLGTASSTGSLWAGRPSVGYFGTAGAKLGEQVAVLLDAGEHLVGAHRTDRPGLDLGPAQRCRHGRGRFSAQGVRRDRGLGRVVLTPV